MNYYIGLVINNRLKADMKKVDIGDIFEIETKKGKGYFQCVKLDKIRCDTVMVFNKLFKERPLIELVTSVEDRYFIGFPLGAAFNRKLVEKVGHASLPNNFQLPTQAREEYIIRGELLGWHIIDIKTLKRELVKKLSPEQMKLSPLSIWNDTMLKETLESGWSLKDWV